VEKLVDRLDDEYSVRAKVLYGLGSELNQFPDGIKRFGEVGWTKLRRCIGKANEGTECQRRVAFFMTNYLAEEDVAVDEIIKNDFFGGFVEILGNEAYVEDYNLLEKVPLETLLTRLCKRYRCLWRNISTTRSKYRNSRVYFRLSNHDTQTSSTKKNGYISRNPLSLCRPLSTFHIYAYPHHFR
jgi:hypothetical protein